MKSSTAMVVAVAMMCTAVAVFAQAQNQYAPAVRLPVIHPTQPQDTNSPTERIAVLEGQVAQLTAQVKSMNAQLAEASKSSFDANFKAGLALNWVNTNGAAAVDAGQFVSGGAPDKLNQILNVVTQNAQGIKDNAQGIKDVDARLYLVCKTLTDHVKGQLQIDSMAQCKASGLDPAYAQQLGAPFY